MVSRCKLRCFRAFPRARPLPPARAPRAHTHSRTHARTHALPGEGRAAASTACNRHTINNNRFLRSGLASRSPASAGGGGGGGGRGAGSNGLGAHPGPTLYLPQGSPLRFTHPAGHSSGPPSGSGSLFAVRRGASAHPPPPSPPTSRNK
nr:zinc finger protein 281-like [Gorilla gorilla gorilla]